MTRGCLTVTRSDETPTRVLVGRFGAPHGVRGEIRLQSFTADPAAIGQYGPLSDANGARRFAITNLRALKDNLFVARLADVRDRDAAAALTHLELFVDRAALPPVDDEEFYHADLVGLAACDADGTQVGTVMAVQNFGAGDMLEVAPAAGGETRLLPFTKAVVPHIDLAQRRLVVIPPTEIDGED